MANKMHITEETLEELLDKLSLMTDPDDEVTITFKNGNEITFKVLAVKKNKWS